jgi:hypothetical protein
MGTRAKQAWQAHSYNIYCFSSEARYILARTAKVSSPSNCHAGYHNMAERVV